jgi:hypothetical protein
MDWGKFQYGDRWHALVDGKPLCRCPGAVVEVKNDPTHEERCENCDKQWRRIGREGKPKASRKGFNTRTVLRPKHKVDWDR